MINLPRINTVTEYQQHFHDAVWKKAAAAICTRHNLPSSNILRTSVGENIIFFIGESYILKIYKPFRDCFARETAALEFMQAVPTVHSPEIVEIGELEGWNYVVMTRLAGMSAKTIWSGLNAAERQHIATDLGQLLCSVHRNQTKHQLPATYTDWERFVEHQVNTSIERQRANNANPEWILSLPSYVSERMELLNDLEPVKFLHGDLHLGNMLFQQENGRWRISGVFDFGDAICGPAEYDFVAPGVLMFQGNRDLQRAFLRAYGYADTELNNDLRAKLMLLTILYECSNLRKYAERLNADAVNLSLEELERAIWRFADKK